eukprot:1566684-Rhodomonas_salina.1
MRGTAIACGPSAACGVVQMCGTAIAHGALVWCSRDVRYRCAVQMCGTETGYGAVRKGTAAYTTLPSMPT